MPTPWSSISSKLPLSALRVLNPGQVPVGPRTRERSSIAGLVDETKSHNTTVSTLSKCPMTFFSKQQNALFASPTRRHQCRAGESRPRHHQLGLSWPRKSQASVDGVSHPSACLDSVKERGRSRRRQRITSKSASKANSPE